MKCVFYIYSMSQIGIITFHCSIATHRVVVTLLNNSPKAHFQFCGANTKRWLQLHDPFRYSAISLSCLSRARKRLCSTSWPRVIKLKLLTENAIYTSNAFSEMEYNHAVSTPDSSVEPNMNFEELSSKTHVATS